MVQLNHLTHAQTACVYEWLLLAICEQGLSLHIGPGAVGSGLLGPGAVGGRHLGRSLSPVRLALTGAVAVICSCHPARPPLSRHNETKRLPIGRQ